jgi:hypothetical protein
MTCFEPYGSRDLAGFLTAVRDVVRKEWDRQRGGPPKDVLQQEVWLSEVMSAMQAGKVVPGFYLGLGDAICFMDWAGLACWARWYSFLDEAGRYFVLDEMARGNLQPWKVTSEYDWPAPPDECDPEASASPTSPCCPKSVWGDPLYAVGLDQYPGDNSIGSASSSSKTTTVVLVVGIAAVLGIASLAVASASRPSPRLSYAR